VVLKLNQPAVICDLRLNRSVSHPMIRTEILTVSAFHNDVSIAFLTLNLMLEVSKDYCVLHVAEKQGQIYERLTPVF